ncbi:MAG: hypothetical protein R3293_19130 [Candidatus Promineifilaceae bacterium]|nr:hypothetical protein [Candidatus Promineifilaceae bacterium]
MLAALVLTVPRFHPRARFNRREYDNRQGTFFAAAGECEFADFGHHEKRLLALDRYCSWHVE